MVVCGDRTTYLRTVGVERGLLVKCLDGLCVEVQRSRPVMSLESGITLVLELGGIFLGSHDVSTFMRTGGVDEAHEEQVGATIGEWNRRIEVALRGTYVPVIAR